MKTQTLTHLMKLRDHFLNIQADNELSSVDSEMQDEINQLVINSRIQDLQYQIDELNECIDWVRKQ